MGNAGSTLSAEQLAAAAEGTHFSAEEVAACAFMAEYPSGAISRLQFLDLFARFYPRGESAPWASLVFRHYDDAGTGAVSFARYLAVLSVQARGRIEEKVRWAFSFYDQDGDGVVSRADLAVVLDALHRLAGGTPTATAFLPDRSEGALPPSPASEDDGWRSAEETWSVAHPADKIKAVFGAMAKVRPHAFGCADTQETQLFITLDEFRAGVHSDSRILHALLLFDGVC